MVDDDEVPLALYAAVIAALGEGYPLAVVLEHEGLSHDTWEAAEERWVDRLEASAEGDLSLFDSLERALADARASFARPVDPLDDDLDHFLAFKHHLAAAEKPTAMLAEHGLFLGDWVRLQERWAENLGADSALRTKAAIALSASEAPPLPVVRPGPRQLPPPRRPRPAARVGVTTVSYDVAEPVEWGLSIFRDTPQIHDGQHSATAERLSPFGAESPVVTSAAGSSTPEPQHEIHTEARSLPIPGELPAFAHHLGAMAKDPLPFRPGAPAVAIPTLPPEVEAAIRAIPEGISGDTTLPISPLEQIRAATRAPLPFKTGAPSNAQTPPQPPTSVAWRVAAASATLPPPSSNRTAKQPLPFKMPEEPTSLTASAGIRPETGGPPLGSGLDPDDMPTLQRSATTKDPEPAGPDATVQPSLTLEQYAQLCVQLSKEPTRAVEIRARYGLADESAWAIAQWRWQDRMDRDPDLHRRWLELTASIQGQK